jgi:hypothetical protein
MRSCRVAHRYCSRAAAAAVCVAILLCAPRAALAQQTIGDVLSFLLTNRSIPTDDFVQDARAAAAMRDAMTQFLLAELTTLPISSPSSGFTYRLDPALGASVRSTETFGPFFTQRSLTVGRRQISFGVGYQRADYRDIDGRSLRDGTLVATASRLTVEPDPFDVETLSLRLRTQTTTVTANVGLTDRLDVAAAVPFVRLTLDGTRVDTYRGTRLVQAAALASASGPGDVVVRANYNVLRFGASGLSAGAEVRLPTGNRDNLLGSGDLTVTPRAIGSVEYGRVGVHGHVGVTAGGTARETSYAAAVTVAGTDRLTLVGEVVGRRISSGGRLVETAEPHPTLAGVETIRLSSTTAPSTRAVLVAGCRWNVASRLLFSVSVVRPLTSQGLTAAWTPTAMFDYAF